MNYFKLCCCCSDSGGGPDLLDCLIQESQQEERGRTKEPWPPSPASWTTNNNSHLWLDPPKKVECIDVRARYVQDM